MIISLLNIWISTNDPLYPFGYGLSYTTFSYGDLQLDKTSVQGENGVLTASVQVTNTGKLEGEEVVQLYIAIRLPASPVR